jgi:hypothetical protein
MTRVLLDCDPLSVFEKIQRFGCGDIYTAKIPECFGFLKGGTAPHSLFCNRVAKPPRSQGVPEVTLKFEPERTSVWMAQPSLWQPRRSKSCELPGF